MCDFCDGDEVDEKEWLEGPFSQSLTVRELIEYQRGSNRERRRANTDNLLRKAHLRRPREVDLKREVRVRRQEEKKKVLRL